MTAKKLQTLAHKHGTPLVVIDHDILRQNYASFKKHLPKVQAYFAVKANAEPAIVRTLFRAGASFDVTSLPEFMLVFENIRDLPPMTTPVVVTGGAFDRTTLTWIEERSIGNFLQVPAGRKLIITDFVLFSAGDCTTRHTIDFGEFDRL